MRFFFSVITILFVAGSCAFAQPSAYPRLALKTRSPGTVQQQTLFTSASLVKKDSVLTLPMQSRLPLNFYSQHMGAACKMELQLEKQTRLPIRLRLGSKEQVDYLEGKFSRNR